MELYTLIYIKYKYSIPTNAKRAPFFTSGLALYFKPVKVKFVLRSS